MFVYTFADIYLFVVCLLRFSVYAYYDCRYVYVDYAITFDCHAGASAMHIYVIVREPRLCATPRMLIDFISMLPHMRRRLFDADCLLCRRFTPVAPLGFTYAFT